MAIFHVNLSYLDTSVNSKKRMVDANKRNQLPDLNNNNGDRLIAINHTGPPVSAS